MSITPEYKCSRCGEVFDEPEITNRINWKPAEILREIIEKKEEVLHICEDGMGVGEFIGLRLDGEWIEENQRERAKLYKKKAGLIKVIMCKFCDSPCIFPFHRGDYPQKCPYRGDYYDYVENEVELKEIINHFIESEDI